MIPKSVWKDNKLHQPETLTSVYREKSNALGVLQKILDFDGKQSKGAIGGQDESETIMHFIERFLASAARVQYAVINPHKNLNDISNDIKASFGSGTISVLDIPCGTGASILSLLCNIREMRTHKLLPCLPIHISITAGDYSETALEIYADLLIKIKSVLEEVNIFIDYKTHTWDAKDLSSTNKIMNVFLEYKAEEYYVFMSAFSGEVAKNFDTYRDTILHIETRVSDKSSCILHIEPESNEAEKFYRKLLDLINKFIWFKKPYEGKSDKGFLWIHSLNGKEIKGGCYIDMASTYEIIALRALNATKTVNPIAYLGIRCFLDSFSSEFDEQGFDSFIRHKLKVRQHWFTWKHKVYKEIDDGVFVYRDFISLSPFGVIAEAFLLRDILNEKCFEHKNNIYSYIPSKKISIEVLNIILMVIKIGGKT